MGVLCGNGTKPGLEWHGKGADSRANEKVNKAGDPFDMGVRKRRWPGTFFQEDLTGAEVRWRLGHE